MALQDKNKSDHSSRPALLCTGCWNWNYWLICRCTSFVKLSSSTAPNNSCRLTWGGWLLLNHTVLIFKIWIRIHFLILDVSFQFTSYLQKIKGLSNKNQGQQEPKRFIQHKLLMKNINLRSLTYALFFWACAPTEVQCLYLEFYSRAHALNTLTPYWFTITL